MKFIIYSYFYPAKIISYIQQEFQDTLLRNGIYWSCFMGFCNIFINSPFDSTQNWFTFILRLAISATFYVIFFLGMSYLLDWCIKLVKGSVYSIDSYALILFTHFPLFLTNTLISILGLDRFSLQENFYSFLFFILSSFSSYRIFFNGLRYIHSLSIIKAVFLSIPLLLFILYNFLILQ